MVSGSVVLCLSFMNRYRLHRVLASLALSVLAGCCNRRPAPAPPLTPMDITGSSITLHLHDVPADQAFTELFRQAKWSPKSDPADLRDPLGPVKVSVDADHEPFWKVFLPLALKTGVGLEAQGYGPLGSDVNMAEYRLAWGVPMPTGVKEITGPFLVVATRAGRTAYYNQIELELQVLVEPRWVVLNHTSQVRVLEAVDQNGNSLVFDPPIEDQYPTFGATFSKAILRVADPPSHRLVRFRAEMDAVVATRTTQMVIDDVTQAAPRSMVVDATKFTFAGCNGAGDDWDVSLRTSDDHRADKRQLGADAYCTVRAFDAAGRELHAIFGREMKMESSHSAQTVIAFTDRFTCSPAGPPYKLVWTLKTTPKRIVVPILLKNVPLDFEGR
jgi:hypothetical protein